MWYQIQINQVFMPPLTKFRGNIGISMSVCLSVRPSVRLSVDEILSRPLLRKYWKDLSENLYTYYSPYEVVHLIFSSWFDYYFEFNRCFFIFILWFCLDRFSETIARIYLKICTLIIHHMKLCTWNFQLFLFIFLHFTGFIFYINWLVHFGLMYKVWDIESRISVQKYYSLKLLI